MRAKFGRGPTVVSKKGGGGGYHYETFYKYARYNTANNVSTFSMSGTILPTMCQIVNVYQMIKL